MELFINDTYELMSAKAAGAVIRIIQSNKNPVLSPASGDSPTGLYKALVNEVNKNKKVCSNCQKENPNEAKHCMECGNKL